MFTFKIKEILFSLFLFSEEEKQRNISLFLKSYRKLNHQKKGINDLYVSCVLDRTSPSVSRERENEKNVIIIEVQVVAEEIEDPIYNPRTTTMSVLVVLRCGCCIVLYI